MMARQAVLANARVIGVARLVAIRAAAGCLPHDDLVLVACSGGAPAVRSIV